MENEIKTINADVQKLPESAEWWLLLARYADGVPWTACGNLYRDRIEAEAQKQNWSGYHDYRLLRVVLPA